MRQYTLEDFEPIAAPDVWECPSCDEYDAVKYRAIAQHYRYCSDSGNHFLVDYFGPRLRLAYLSGFGRNAIADRLGISTSAVGSALESLDVSIRSHAESVSAWLQNLDEEKRRAVIYGGQDKAADALDKWRAENPDHHLSNSLDNLPDVTYGPDHPSWRGGKSLRDCLTKMYGDEPWGWTRQRIRDRQSNQCYMCGGTSPSGHRLDVHHIVPVLAGGDNHDDNLMALCHGCHHRVEPYTKYVIGLEPVFVEDQI